MNARRVISLLCLIVLLPQCTHFVPYEGPAPPIGEKSVRVTTESGTQIELDDPVVEGADFAGWTDRRDLSSVVRVPLDSIAGFEIRELEGGRTFLLSFGIVLGVLVVGTAACGLGC